MSKVVDSFISAGRNLKICILVDTEGRSRTVQPYMYYTSSKNILRFHCYQLKGYSKSKNEIGWKIPEANSFESLIITEETFEQSDEYNPFNEEKFPIVHFAIPTKDGRVRQAEVN